METHIFLLMIVIELFFGQPICSQTTLVAKTVDTTHQSVVAIFRVDKSGNPWIFGSGVLIHPQVILTAGHVNYRTANRLYNNDCIPEGFVSFGNNVIGSNERIAFNWIKDVDSHPDTADFWNSVFDSTGLTNPSKFIDIGLIFLQQPIYNKPLAILPHSYVLAERKPKDLFLGVGYGYFLTFDTTFKAELMDGKRRQWSFKNIFEINDLWISIDCDSVTKLPFISIHDSGAPLFMRDNLVVGIWSRIDKAPKPCAYSSCAIRIDNPKVLAWTKESVKKRLSINLN